MEQDIASDVARCRAGSTKAGLDGPCGSIKRRRIAAGLLVVITLMLAATYVLWLCFNAEPGRVGLEFPFDLVFYYYPMLEQAAERLRQGELPLWNPYQCCGVPFLATAQTAVFYPPTWIAVFLPVGWAIKTLMFGQVFAAGVFACLFFRSLGKSLFASGIGGVLFIFGCILGQIYWPSEVSTILWLPFLMWCAERFVQSPRWTWWTLFTLGVAMQTLAGFPQFMVYTFYLLGPYVAVRLLAEAAAARRTQARWWRRPAKLSAILLAGCIIAAGLAAVQLVPTMELARNTARSSSLTPKAVHYLESERGRYFKLPGLIENMFDPSAKMITFDLPDGSGYLGMALPLMIGVGLVLGWRDARLSFFVAAVLVSGVLAFGYNDYSGWVYRLYARLPTGNMFRTPSRMLLLTYFGLITIAVFGLDRLGEGLRELRGRMHLRVILSVLAVCFISTADSLGGDEAVRLGASFILLLVASYFVGERRFARSAVQCVFAALLLFDLASAIAPYGSLRDIPAEWGRQPHWAGVSPVRAADLEKAARAAGLNRVALPGLRPTKMIQPPARFHMVTEYEPLLPERWFWANKTMGGEPGFVMSMIDPTKYAPFYDMAGVSHMFRIEVSDLAKKRMGPRQWEIHRWSPAPPPSVGVNCVLEERATALPRAYLVSRYEVCRPADALARFVAADFDHMHSVLLEEEPPLLQGSRESSLRPADIVSYAPERAVIKADAVEPSLLVLSDTFFPGWKAYVDGAEVPILRANYLFRAVVLPAGVHEVVFEYHPASFRAGLTVSGVFMALLAAAVGWAWRNERRVRHRAALR